MLSAMKKTRRKIGRPLLVATAAAATVAYACGTGPPSPTGDPVDSGPDIQVAETSGNLGIADNWAPDASDASASDASDASRDAPDGG